MHVDCEWQPSAFPTRQSWQCHLLIADRREAGFSLMLHKHRPPSMHTSVNVDFSASCSMG